MAKPILITTIGRFIGQDPQAIDNMSDAVERCMSHIDDYHRLVLFDHNQEEDVLFRVLNSSNAEDVDIEQLREMVLETIESLKN